MSFVVGRMFAKCLVSWSRTSLLILRAIVPFFVVVA